MRRFSTGPLGPAKYLETIKGFLNAGKPTTESLRSALVACSRLEAAYKASSRPDYTELPTQHSVEEARELLNSVLQVYETTSDNSAKITNQTLMEYFTCDYPPSTLSSLRVLEAFAKKSPTHVVPEPIAMIPFRRAIYRADFPGALDVMALTCGKRSNYSSFMNKKIYKYGALWGLGTGSVLTGIHSILMSGNFGVWDSGTSAMVCVMFGTYLTALSVYGAMAVSSSKSGLGPVLEWVPGTSPIYRIKHGLQLKMATFATELNRSLPENLGECSPQILQDLQEINLKPVETTEEAYLKEYWARAGAGFEWVEPDQDPAEILWSRHMEATRQNRITSAYSRKDSEGKLLSWMSEVEKEKQGHSIPHASLVDKSGLDTPDDMKSFEKELENDMKQIRESKASHRGEIGSGKGEDETEDSSTSDKDQDGTKK